MLIDRFMPVFDVSEQHLIRVKAPADRTYKALRMVDLTQSRVIRSLFAVRGIPRLVRRRPRAQLGNMTLDDLVRGGFMWLDEDPGAEIVLGVVGSFWRLSGGVLRIEPEEFEGFDRPGYAKAAWNFRVVPDGDDASIVTTETRVRVPDEASRKKFALYWAAIGPFSGLVRKQALVLVRAAAEGG
jgi:hypothetical protein